MQDLLRSRSRRRGLRNWIPHQYRSTIPELLRIVWLDQACEIQCHGRNAPKGQDWQITIL